MTQKELDGKTANVDDAPVVKKRARIVKKETDHVYSASLDQGERFDTVSEERAHKREAAHKANSEKTAVIHALESEVLVPPRKNRGRPSKAYLEAQRAYEEAVARQQEQIDAARAAFNGDVKGTKSAEAESVENAAETEVLAEDAVVAPAETVTELQENAASEAAEADAQVDAEDTQAEVKPAVAETADDDVPEFVRMQQAAAMQQDTAENDEDAKISEEQIAEALAAKAIALAQKTENNAPNPPSALEEVSSAEAPTVDVELMQRLTAAYKDGQRFIIVDDVPVINADGYIFMDQPDADMDASDNDAPVRFRRFADDFGVAASQQAVDNAPAGVVDNSASASAKGEAENAKAEKPAPLPHIGDIIIPAEGVVELDNQGVGYLRSSDYNFMPSPDDVFVTQNQVRNYALKTGDMVSCTVRAPKEGEKYYTVAQILSINGCAPTAIRDRIAFEHLTPLFPDEQYKLSKRGEKSPLSCRIVDLFAPIGKGQRALIVAQPKTGKTILMKQIANAIAANNPEAYLIMLLIDERPEEVTDMARTVNAEVIASTFDEPAKRHVRIANMVLEKAKRMVECGRDVVIFLDSITRLARAFNTEAPASGKILSGGVDANALQKPKRFFGAARNIEGGGSLTIIATALIDTGSRMDEVIFEEFKGTGNMELQLDRNLANKRIFPAVNLVQSSTRREDLLLDETTVNRMFITRNYMADMSPIEAMNFIRKHLESTISNEEFIATMGS